MQIDFPTALGFTIAFCTAILAFFSVLIAYFLGRNVYKYRTELDEISSRVSQRQDDFEARFQTNSYILCKLELTIFLLQSKENASKAKQQVLEYFEHEDLNSETAAKLNIKLSKFDERIAIRNQEMQLLASNLVEGQAILNGLVIYSGDEDTVVFLNKLLGMYEDDGDRALLNKSIGKLESRISGAD